MGGDCEHEAEGSFEPGCSDQNERLSSIECRIAQSSPPGREASRRRQLPFRDHRPWPRFHRIGTSARRGERRVPDRSHWSAGSAGICTLKPHPSARKRWVAAGVLVPPLLFACGLWSYTRYSERVAAEREAITDATQSWPSAPEASAAALPPSGPPPSEWERLRRFTADPSVPDDAKRGAVAAFAREYRHRGAPRPSPPPTAARRH